LAPGKKVIIRKWQRESQKCIRKSCYKVVNAPLGIKEGAFGVKVIEVKIEVLISNEINRTSVGNRIKELTKDFKNIPWELLTKEDIQRCVDAEYKVIGDL